MTRYTTESIYVIKDGEIILRGDGPHGPEETAAHAQRAAACLNACDGYGDPADMRRWAHIGRRKDLRIAHRGGDNFPSIERYYLNRSLGGVYPVWHRVAWLSEDGGLTDEARAAVDALIGGGE